MAVEVATNTGVTTTASPKTLIQLELSSDHKNLIMHMQLELRHGVIVRMTQAMLPNIQQSCRSGLGGASSGDHSRGYKG